MRLQYMREESGKAVEAILVGVVLALLVGGSAPWWWSKLFPDKKEPPKTDACAIAGRVFDRNTQAPVAGVFIDLYTYQDMARIKESRLLQTGAAITGPDGTFKAFCRGITDADFPLRIAVGRRGNDYQPTTIFMPIKVELHDTRTDINLPTYFDK